jgi:hypothetical protein
MKIFVNRLNAIVICALSVTLALVVTMLVYVSINGGAALDGARQASASYKHEADVLRSLLLDIAPLNQQQAWLVVQKKYSNLHVVKRDKQSISIDSVMLKYDNSELISVCSMQDNSCVSRFN